MMHLLEGHLSVRQYRASIPSCSCSLQLVSSPATLNKTYRPSNSASYCLQSEAKIPQTSLDQSELGGELWSHSGMTDSQTGSHQPFCQSNNHQPLSKNPVGLCLSCERVTSHQWMSPPLLRISSDYQAGSPHTPNKVSRAPSPDPTTSHSPSILCSQPPSDDDEYSCLLPNAPTSTSTLLEPPATNETVSSEKSPPSSHTLTQDTAILQIDDLPQSPHPIFTAAPLLHSKPSSLDTELPLDVSCLPLGDPSTLEHNSLECFLGNRDSTESRDSGSASSRRSSIGVQTKSSEQSWCLDLNE